MYEPVPVRTSERLIYHASQFIVHATFGFLRWLWRADHVSRWVALIVLIPIMTMLAGSVGLGALADTFAVLLVFFVIAATLFGGPRRVR